MKRRDFLKGMVAFSGAVILGGPKDALDLMERNVPVAPMNPEGLTSESLERARQILNEQPAVDAYKAVVHPKTAKALAFEESAWNHLRTKPNVTSLFLKHLQDRVEGPLETAGFQIPRVLLRMPGGNDYDPLDDNILIGLKAYKSPVPLVRGGGIPQGTQCYGNMAKFSPLYQASRETVEHIGWTVEDMAKQMILAHGNPVA